VAKFNRFIIYLAAYKGDAVVLETAPKTKNQSYPSDKYDVIVLADHCLPETINKLKTHDLEVIDLSFVDSTKVKSLQAGINQTKSSYDYAILLDIDNVMDEHFLRNMNARLQNNEVIIQGRRTALNRDTDVALLDSLSEEINNHIFRKGHRTLKVPSALSGSGKAMRFDEYVRFINQIEAVGGFDKELEVLLNEEQIDIEYLHDAVVFDEKVQSSDRLKKQRTRWLSAQFHYLKLYGLKGLSGLFQGNVNLFLKVIQLFLLPRVMILGLSFMALLMAFICESEFWIKIFSLQFAVILLALLGAIPTELWNKRLLKALLSLPGLFVSFILVALRLKGANDSFIHTDHSAQNK
jgi:cellulose synthase/poly-beta-1,6-N-acetylglucosamine synthase-like glycosyltransferase